MRATRGTRSTAPQPTIRVLACVLAAMFSVVLDARGADGAGVTAPAPPPAAVSRGMPAAMPAPGPALVRDLRPTTLERGDRLVVELLAGAPRGPAVIILTPGGIGASSEPSHRAPGVGARSAVALRARGLGDGRVVADIGGDLEARVGRDRHWRDVTVEVALTDTGQGNVWTQTGGHRVWRTPPGERYELSFFPGTLGGLASQISDRFHTAHTAHAAVRPDVGGADPRSGVLGDAVLVAGALVILLLVAPATGLLVVWERKIAGRMQSRLGPNRVGPGGWLQWLADGIKLIVKEDLIPTDADPLLFRLSPYLMWMGIFATLVALPLAEFAVVADLNIGLLYLSSVTTLTVIAIIMGGWASNSKWSLLGGMRSAAQIVSYELPASMSLLSVVVMAGTLSPQSIVREQGGLPFDWYLFRTPFTFVAFAVYFVSALAEGNRTPFDLPEAESELVAGYHTEFSGFRWSIFQLAEWTNIYVVGAVSATVFLGGWNVPFVPADVVADHLGWQVASLGVMLAKVVCVSFVIIWIRWTLPRFRVDQLMELCWKLLLPAAFVVFVASAAWTWAIAAAPVADRLMRWLVFLTGGLGLGGLFLHRLIRAFRRTRLLHVGNRQFTLPFVERHLEKR